MTGRECGDVTETPYGTFTCQRPEGHGMPHRGEKDGRFFTSWQWYEPDDEMP